MFDKDKIKEELTIDQIEELLVYFQGEPIRRNGSLISRTICHNHSGEGSHKLYYYENNGIGLFHCYTGCDENSFDVFELIIKIYKNEYNQDLSLPQAIQVISNLLGLSFEDNEIEISKTKSFLLLDKWSKLKEEMEVKQEIKLNICDESILRFFPTPRIAPWEEEGISDIIIKANHIAYNPLTCGIIIPHYNKDNKLIGIRERSLTAQGEEYGKYKPAVIHKKMYNHPLGFNLYNLNNSYENIKKIKKVILFEAEKSTFKYASYFGQKNDISVATCGSSISNYQFQLLYELGIEELIIGFDKQYEEIGNEEYKKWIKKLINLSNKFKQYVNVTFLFDIENLLDYKDSPIDKGKDIFLTLFYNRLDANGKKR